MTTLLERCQAVTSKVDQFKLAQINANQQLLVQRRTQEWKSRHDKLKSVNARASCLPLGAEAQRRVNDKRALLRDNATQVLERLKTREDIAQLTDDAVWTRLLASVEGLADELETSGKSAWKAYIDEQGALEDPAWLRNRAPSTPMNDAAIAAYKQHYSAYSGLAQLALPRSTNDLARLSEIIAACRAEAAKLTFDVPPDVQRFFHAIQSGSATLASLTSGVLEWLAENGLLERFRIRSASQ